MNTPGKFGSNWDWRFNLDDFTPHVQVKLKELALTYGRAESAEKQERPEWM